MRVADLKPHLVARNLSVKGVKTVLVARLKDAIRNNVPFVTSLNTVVLENMAGNGFAPTAYWKLIPPDKNNIITEEGLMRGPTIPAGEDIAVAASKYNYTNYYNRPPFCANSSTSKKKSKS